MKRNTILLLFFLFIFSLSALISCSGGPSSSGGGKADFASITLEGGDTVLYTEATNTNAIAGYSPYLSSYSTGTNSTYVYSMDWNGSEYVTRFQVHTWATGAGTFSINGDYAMVMFMPEGGPTYSGAPNAEIYGVTGTINITEFGPVGGKVKGTFDVISLVIVNSAPTGTAHLTGSFSVTRD